MKKIIFIMCLFLCVFDVGVTASNSVVEFAEVNVVDFSININEEKSNSYNSYKIKSNDMPLFKYPLVMYKNITYVPLTYYNCILLGVELKTEDNQVFIKKSNLEKPEEYLKDQLEEKREETKTMKISPFVLNIQGIEYYDEEYPALFYKDIVYLPLTWNVVNNIMQWDFTFNEEGIELYTDSYYYYSEGDSSYEIKKDGGMRATTSYGKTYYQKDGKRVFASIYHQTVGGPTWDNMKITVGNETISIPGHTGYGQKQGPVFTVEGEYIYTVHSDRTKYAPCKIKIDTGEIIYTDGEN